MRRALVLVVGLSLTACIPVKKPGENWYYGGTVPDGQRIEKRTDPNMISAGASTAATGYLILLFPVGLTLADQGPHAENAAINFIPVVGPMLFVHTVPPDEQPIVGGGREYLMAYTSAIAQVAGLAMLVAAAANARPVLVKPTTEITVVPVPWGSDGAGVLLTARF